jgi:hypothetical protein
MALLNGKIRNSQGKSTNYPPCGNTDNWEKQKRTTVSQQQQVDESSIIPLQQSCYMYHPIRYNNVNFTHRMQFYGSLVLSE